jgi:thioredoxin reductase
MSEWDCVVVGGGAAGLSAALVLGRARRQVLVIDAGEQANLPAHGIGGLLGHDGRPPAELYATGRAELAKYPTVAVVEDRVESVARAGDQGSAVATGFVLAAAAGEPAHRGTATGFVLATAAGALITADRLLLATGMRYAPPELPGIAELWGDTVFHCPYCHGWEARDGALAVLAPAEALPHVTRLLRGWSDDVIALTDGPFEGELVVPADTRRVAGVRGEDGRLAAIVFDDGSELPRTGLLAAPRMERRSELAASLGAAVAESGGLDVDAAGKTTVPGVYGAGDVSSPFPQVSAAIASGAFVAAVINDDIVSERYGTAPHFPDRVEVAAR